MSPLFIRNFSHRASRIYRSPRTIMMYSYLVAGFSLPFALPVAKKLSAQNNNGGGDISLYHCCR
ncbi:unnamed protein product [Tuber melanosporum]|uniref:(Perigord truffle) hypothetical protein n=1 Tax=Tuber melanosporum (strain Mel28) TaxID=656061 RepID=D5GP66_TUBMM|nr:uncharacterized protein GSTUM_00011727001 [Tuber melanosporum]CAZ86331.1 unnamed protein product [Tuber melanosporum]